MNAAIIKKIIGKTIAISTNIAPCRAIGLLKLLSGVRKVIGIVLDKVLDNVFGSLASNQDGQVAIDFFDSIDKLRR